MPPIHFVYFDLDDTLLDHRRAERLALTDVYHTHHAAFGHLSLSDVHAIYHQHNVVVWRSYAAGDLTKKQAKRARFQRLFDACGVAGLEPEAVSDLYLHRYSHYWTYCTGARDAFHAIADHYPVGVLTNGFTEIQRAKLAQFTDIQERLQALVISEEVGHLKPHPALFAHAADQAQVAPASILYVGDSFHSDVQGATKAGWQMAWYTTDDRPLNGLPVFRFEDWSALMNRLLPST